VKAAALTTISGERVDLGLVGEPSGGDVALVADLLRLRYVPVIASVGVTTDGTLLNVNADTFAAHLAASLGARRLIVAGTTPGVLDGGGGTIPQLTGRDVEHLTASGTAHSGMVAKLTACRQALDGGVGEVSIVAGRGVEDFDAAVGTRVC
jgi:acetylglutamate kinase